MDRLHYVEMLGNEDTLAQSGQFQAKDIYLFGYSNATEALADVLLIGKRL